MVKITSFDVRQKHDGTTFITLCLTGQVELIQSQSTSQFYATVRKVSIPCTFDADTAQMMIGKEIEGSIERVATPEYTFVNKRTGEVMQLAHSWAYRPKGSVELIGQTQVQDLQLAEN